MSRFEAEFAVASLLQPNTMGSELLLGHVPTNKAHTLRRARRIVNVVALFGVVEPAYIPLGPPVPSLMTPADYTRFLEKFKEY